MTLRGAKKQDLAAPASPSRYENQAPVLRLLWRVSQSSLPSAIPASAPTVMGL